MEEEINYIYSKATGIGSLPHLSAVEALELIKETIPWGPHWPQLPKRGRAENFIMQYLSPLAKLDMVNLSGGAPFFNDKGEYWLEKVETFYQLYLDCESGREKKEKVLDFFAFPRDSAEGFYYFLENNWSSFLPRPSFLKGHLSGPLTVGLQVNAADGTPSFYKEELRDILTKNLSLIARFQVQALSKFSFPVLIFIDEPALLSFGQFTHVSLSRRDIVESLSQLVEAIQVEAGLAGVHCCAGVDWSVMFELPVQVVNFDAYDYFESMLVYTEELKDFLKRGGCLSWGIVPASDQVEKEDVFSLKERFFRGIERLSQRGVPEDLLKGQYLITPSCGTGTLSVSCAEKVYRATYQLCRELQEVLK